MPDVKKLLSLSAARHDHLCPRQVLGVRMGLAGTAELGIPLPNPNKRLLTIIETDGCFADGIEVSTGCTIGHRTLRVEDYGKVAATFADTKRERVIRLHPKPDIRQRAQFYCPEETRHYFYQLQGYQIMPSQELFDMEEVELTISLDEILSRPRKQTSCEHCGEEIINEREVDHEGQTLCVACRGSAYYREVAQPVDLPIKDGAWLNSAL